MRFLVAFAPLWYLACMAIAYAVAWHKVGHQPDANRVPATSIGWGVFYFAALGFLLLTLFAFPLTIRWGVQQKQWRWLLFLALSIVLWIVVIALDPLSVRSWFLY